MPSYLASQIVTPATKAFDIPSTILDYFHTVHATQIDRPLCKICNFDIWPSLYLWTVGIHQ